MKTPKILKTGKTPSADDKKNRVRLTREHFDNLRAFDNGDIGTFGANVRINDTLSMGDF